MIQSTSRECTLPADCCAKFLYWGTHKSVIMKNVLLISLLLLAIAMIVVGIKSQIVPPILTGVGFVIIAELFRRGK
jgi:hypothetical protein